MQIAALKKEKKRKRKREKEKLKLSGGGGKKKMSFIVLPDQGMKSRSQCRPGG